jgi:hypothetical protein
VSKRTVPSGAAAVGAATGVSAQPATKSLNKSKKVCKFFLTPKGCRNGTTCKNLHPAPAASSAAPTQQ